MLRLTSRAAQGAPQARAQASNKCKTKSVHSCGNAGDCDLGYQLLCSRTSLSQHAPCIIPPRTHCPNRGMRAPTWERQHPGPARLNRHGPYAVCRAAAAFIETHSTGLQLSARALRLSAPPLASVPLCPGKSSRAPEEAGRRTLSRCRRRHHRRRCYGCPCYCSHHRPAAVAASTAQPPSPPPLPSAPRRAHALLRSARAPEEGACQAGAQGRWAANSKRHRLTDMRPE